MLRTVLNSEKNDGIQASSHTYIWLSCLCPRTRHFSQLLSWLYVSFVFIREEKLSATFNCNARKRGHPVLIGKYGSDTKRWLNPSSQLLHVQLTLLWGTGACLIGQGHACVADSGRIDKASTATKLLTVGLLNTEAPHSLSATTTTATVVETWMTSLSVRLQATVAKEAGNILLLLTYIYVIRLKAEKTEKLLYLHTSLVKRWCPLPSKIQYRSNMRFVFCDVTLHDCW